MRPVKGGCIRGRDDEAFKAAGRTYVKEHSTLREWWLKYRFSAGWGKRLNCGQSIISLICDSYPQFPPWQVVPGAWAWYGVLAARAGWGPTLRCGMKRERVHSVLPGCEGKTRPRTTARGGSPVKRSGGEAGPDLPLGQPKGVAGLGKIARRLGLTSRTWSLSEGVCAPGWGRVAWIGTTLRNVMIFFFFLKQR